MAANTDEEHLDNPINDQSGSPPDEINSTNDRKPVIPKNEIENMEVHHHPNLHHNTKKWKEYFLEFLMIFLAVTMGFIAENIREHITEHKNAKILAKSLLEDIKKDTASLHTLVTFSNKKLSNADNIISILHSPLNHWNDTVFYRNIGPVMTSIPFISTEGTYEQMKTSGSLRYFHQSLVNQMNAYDVQLKKTEYRDNVEDKGIWIIGTFNFDIINLEAMNDLRYNKPITHEMYIKFADKTMIDKFINLVMVNKAFCTRSIQEYEAQLKIADKLIYTLKKEYALD